MFGSRESNCEYCAATSKVGTWRSRANLSSLCIGWIDECPFATTCGSPLYDKAWKGWSTQVRRGLHAYFPWPHHSKVWARHWGSMEYCAQWSPRPYLWAWKAYYLRRRGTKCPQDRAISASLRLVRGSPALASQFGTGWTRRVGSVLVACRRFWMDIRDCLAITLKQWFVALFSPHSAWGWQCERPTSSSCFGGTVSVYCVRFCTQVLWLLHQMSHLGWPIWVAQIPGL